MCDQACVCTHACVYGQDRSVVCPCTCSAHGCGSQSFPPRCEFRSRSCSTFAWRVRPHQNHKPKTSLLQSLLRTYFSLCTVYHTSCIYTHTHLLIDLGQDFLARGRRSRTLLCRCFLWVLVKGSNISWSIVYKKVLARTQFFQGMAEGIYRIPIAARPSKGFLCW